MGGMVKSSLKGDQFSKSGFGIQEGRVRLGGCEFVTVQHVKKDQSLVTPYMALRSTETQKLDANNNAEGEAEVKDFIVCWGSKEVQENGLHKFAFQPCKADGPTDSDMEMLGNEDGTVEIGASGPTFGAMKDMTPFENSEIALFIKALEDKNFSASINAQCWAPNYDNLVIEVVSIKIEDLCKKLGVKPPQKQEGKDSPMVWDVVKIVFNPHDKANKGKTAPGATTKKEAASSKANGKDKEPEDTGGGDRTEDQKKCDAAVLEFAKSKTGETITVKEFERQMSTKLIKAAKGPAAVQYNKAVFKAEGGLDELSMLLEGAFTVDGDHVTFA